jgi:SHAQKYF class myb-like DNA-binding protein
MFQGKLHQCFVQAVEQLGLKNAVPKTIMQACSPTSATRLHPLSCPLQSVLAPVSQCVKI